MDNSRDGRLVVSPDLRDKLKIMAINNDMKLKDLTERLLNFALSAFKKDPTILTVEKVKSLIKSHND